MPQFKKGMLHPKEGGKHRASYALLLLASSSSAVEATSTHMQNANTKSCSRGSAEELVTHVCICVQLCSTR